MLKRFTNTPPILCFEITDRCNMSCPKCITSSHKSAGSPQLSLARITSALLTPFRFAGGKQLVISGGEPTLSEKLLPLIESAVSLRLKVFLASNLYRTDPRLMQAMLELMNDRRHTIMFSYDSIVPEEMKHIRGVDAHKEVTANIQTLLTLKERLGIRTKLAACLVLQKENSESAAETLQFLVGLKLDKIIVQPVNLYGVVDLSNFRTVVPPYEKTDLQKILQAVDTIFSLAGTFPEIQIACPDIQRWRRHFTSPTSQTSACKSHGFIFVDSYGNFRGCNNSKIYARLDDVGVVDFHNSTYYEEHLRLTDQCSICLHTST